MTVTKKMLHHLPLLVNTIILLILIALPTGFEDAVIYQGADRVRAEVVATDNSMMISSGLIQSGEQRCTLNILSGKFKGQQLQGSNLLSGSLESDKVFATGDTALVLISYTDDTVRAVSMVDHYRLGQEFALLALFSLALVLFAKSIGLRSLLSFFITVLAIWKILVPYCLAGRDPILTGLLLVIILTIAIISLVYGYDRRCMAASCGVILGILTTCILAIIFTQQFKIHGAVMPYSESLLYAGYQHLNLTQIFMASVFLGASGALMDIAVDITSAVDELVAHNPRISKKAAIKSGLTVGRAAMGTMSTTLLLAYSGGYITLLMVFMAQGTPIVNILNYKYVSAEILHTIVGSFGLIAVAPFTAIMAGALLAGKKDTAVSQNQISS